jgi:hypothetical protein
MNDAEWLVHNANYLIAERALVVADRFLGVRAIGCNNDALASSGSKRVDGGDGFAGFLSGIIDGGT